MAAMLAMPGLALTGLALAGCDGSGTAKRQVRTDPPTAGPLRILCAAGTAALAPDCTVEREASPEGPLLTVRRSDGGFRRLLATGDGRGVVAADGAESARVSVVGRDEIEVALAGRRYRLPATVKR